MRISWKINYPHLPDFRNSRWGAYCAHRLHYLPSTPRPSTCSSHSTERLHPQASRPLTTVQFRGYSLPPPPYNLFSIPPFEKHSSKYQSADDSSNFPATSLLSRVRNRNSAPLSDRQPLSGERLLLRQDAAMAPETFGDSLARRATDVATPRLTGTPARSLQMCRYEKSTLHAPLPRAYTRLPSCAYTRLPSCVYKSGWCRRYSHPTLLQPQMFPAPPWRQHRGFYDHNLADSTTTQPCGFYDHNLATPGCTSCLSSQSGVRPLLPSTDVKKMLFSQTYFLQFLRFLSVQIPDGKSSSRALQIWS